MISHLRWWFLAGLCLLMVGVLGAQERPLPEKEAFLRETRKHLQVDSTLQSSYVYVETRRERKLDRDGRISEETVRVIESYPGLPGEPRWDRMIAQDGKPVSPEWLAEQDRNRRKKAEDMARRLATKPAEERARQERDWAKQRRERDEAVDDIYRVFDIQMLGREPIEGHDTIAFSLMPKPDAKPRTREGGIMEHFAVRAWISESDHELVRLDADAIETVSFGMGLLARLHKGAHLSFLRRKVNNEVWLPAVASYQGSARVGLLFVLRRSGTSEFTGYRKYAVETTERLRETTNDQ